MDKIENSPGSSKEPDGNGGAFQEHAYFKQPVKGPNQDFCDVCKGCVDLIDCDECTKSYHLHCHDPPLNFENLPRGKWSCHSCKFQRKKMRHRQKQLVESSVTEAPATKSPTVMNPSELLIEAAKYVDPAKFEKPPMETDLPGIKPAIKDRKSIFADPELIRKLEQRQRDRESMLTSSLPISDLCCAKCQKSCKVAALIECDFCNSYFHVNCLEPPLSALPLGLWMCPLHETDTLSPDILSSASMCERVALRDKFVPPNDDARGNTGRIVVMRPKSNNSPAFAFKRLFSRKALIPGEVSCSYVSKPTTINEELETAEQVSGDNQDTEMRDETNKENEQENSGIEAETIMEVCEEGGGEDDSTPRDISETGHIDNKVPEKTANVHPLPTNTNTATTAHHVNKEANKKKGRGSNRKKYDRNVDIKKINQIEEARSLVEKKKTIIKDIINGSFLRDAEQDLRQLDDRMIRNLAYERLQQLDARLVNNLAVERLQQFPEPNLGERKFFLPSELLSTADKVRISRTVGTKVGAHPGEFLSDPKLAERKFFLPSELLSTADKVRITRMFQKPKVSRPTNKARAMVCPVVSKHFYNIRSQEVNPAEVRHDASYLNLRPTVSKRFPEAIAMDKQLINVGKGSSNDIDLEVFGHCNFVASLHATIFFNGFENCFELINYSPHGTRVNSVLYSDNASQAHLASLRERERDKTPNVGRIVNPKSREAPNKKNRLGNVDIPKMATPGSTPRVECACGKGVEKDLRRHSEGSAILHHGALLKFGCLGFVFSIVDRTKTLIVDRTTSYILDKSTT